MEIRYADTLMPMPKEADEKTAEETITNIKEKVRGY